MRAVGSLLGGLFAAAWLAGCGSGERTAASPAPSPQTQTSAAATNGTAAVSDSGIPEAAQAQARQIFETRCFTCHGATGRGDGPASAGLTPRPRNLADVAWQESVSDAQIEQIIQYGGAVVGRSPAMPGNPDLMNKPEVVAALRAHVRSLAH